MADRVCRLLMPLTVTACALVVLCCWPAVEAQEKKGPAGGGEKLLRKAYYGVSGCTQRGCHAEEKERDLKEELLCRCNEATIWNKGDKHADAYKVLTGERGQQMLKFLGIDLGTKEQAKACLSCHAVIVEDPKQALKSFRIEEGVSCVLCHGPYREWIGEHSLEASREEFRVLKRKEKEDRYGMYDLWDPIRRSQLCASCHIGNASGGQVVTHEMYAAGHPPLPGFEIASFSDLMPRHWEYLSQKKSAKVRRILEYDGKTQERAKMVLVGAAVSLAEYARLVAVQATACLTAKDDDKKVLDWANFDCWSCHHDLKSPSWRQARGYPGKPGRVPLKTWPAELVRLALAHLGENPAAFERQWGELQAAAVARQFGDNARIAKSASALAAWADGLAKKLNESTVDAAAAKQLLEKLPKLVKADPDFDSARQLGWAYRALWEEQFPKKDLAPLKELVAELGLQLPEGRMKEGHDGVIVRDLGKSLKRLNDYAPARFLDLWKGLPGPGR
jgi:hypothetical protein